MKQKRKIMEVEKRKKKHSGERRMKAKGRKHGGKGRWR